MRHRVKRLRDIQEGDTDRLAALLLISQYASQDMCLICDSESFLTFAYPLVTLDCVGQDPVVESTQNRSHGDGAKLSRLSAFA